MSRDRHQRHAQQVAASERARPTATRAPASGFTGSLWVLLALVFFIAVAYAPIRHAGFVSFDDPFYMSDNPHVAAGLTAANVAWAFTTGFAANWFPLTWMSHMLDVQLFGLRAGPAHVVNVVIHALNAVLLFVLLRRLTGAHWRGAIVAGLFAVHPLHVESVAWISERKDLLSTLFGLLTIWAYAAWVRGRGVKRYLTVMAAFALSLLSKPMLVTLPFLLMLLDVWPLDRASFRRYPLALVKEKIPLLLLAAASSVITFVVQRTGGAVLELEAVGLQRRVANAILAFGAYLAKAVWPIHLSVFYPYRPHSVWQIAAAATLLAGITAICVWTVRSRPYFLVGWLWFAGMLVPVIGLVQVGSQAMADRYTYLSLVGIFVALVWGLADYARARMPATRSGPAVSLVVLPVLLSCVAVTRHQVRTWTDSISLWEHANQVSQPNLYAESALASALALNGQTQRATDLFEHVLRARPDLADAQNDYAQLLAEQGRPGDAIIHFEEAIRLNPKYAEAHHNLGVTLMTTGDFDRAKAEFLEALRLNPDLAKAHASLGELLLRRGDVGSAVAQFQDALRLMPTLAEAHNGLGKAAAAAGQPDRAIAEFAEAARLAPQDAESRYNLGVAFMTLGRTQQAIESLREATRLDPKLSSAHNNLGSALTSIGDLNGALAEFQDAVRLSPQDADFHFNLALGLLRQNRGAEAVTELRSALQLNPDHARAREVLADLLKRSR